MCKSVSTRGIDWGKHTHIYMSIQIKENKHGIIQGSMTHTRERTHTHTHTHTHTNTHIYIRGADDKFPGFFVWAFKIFVDS